MKHHPPVFPRLARGGLALGLCLASLAWAAPPPGDAIEAAYRKERAHCMSGRSSQERPTCLREAAAARDAARHGRLGDVDARALAENALLRCQRVPQADRADCERLARGEGRRDGSVAEGAVVKEVRRVLPNEPAASAPR
jgi:hypothetical protein